VRRTGRDEYALAERGAAKPVGATASDGDSRA
jgi:hypothetical protein